MSKISTRIAYRLTALGLCAVLAAACAGPSYYSQAVSGHMRLMNQREDIQDVLDSEATDPELARELELALQIRKFAVTELDLPDNDSYSQLVLTGRDAVTWNVVAAPEFSLSPKQWCFLGSGCVPYRGYFREDDAVEFAGSMAARGFDTTVSPAIAYSTLGWFDDPLLDTMLRYSDRQLAAFLFHELAHQKLYVKGDTAFNEAYASFVEHAGVTRWLADHGEPGQMGERQKAGEAALELNELLQATREQLREIYNSDLAEAPMREAKTRALGDLATAYRALVESRWGGHDYYAALFSRELNNASLALINTYDGGSCAFERLYDEAGRDMPSFHQLSAEKAKLSSKARKAWLNRSCEAIASSGDL